MSERLLPAAQAGGAVATLPDRSRTGGLMVFAPSGWGKSRLLGRALAHQDFLRGVGLVVFDVVGATIDNALDKLLYLPGELQQAALGRVRYCNLAGERGSDGRLHVPTFPMLCPQTAGESLFLTAQRVVDLIAKTDRALATASIQGLNRLAPLLTSVAMVLAALRLPISAADDLLARPQAWSEQLTRAQALCPEAAPAVAALQEFLRLPEAPRAEWSEPLRNKLSLVRLDAVSRTMFSAEQPSFDWDEVARKGLCVLIDLRHERSDRARELKLFWVWNSLLEWVRARGASGRRLRPLSVVIDEISYFVRGTHLNTEVISEEFRELVQVRKRNANIWLTAATQEQLELPETLRRACLQMANQLYGATIEPDTALRNVKRWATLDPGAVKWWRNVWASDSLGFLGGTTKHFVIDREPVFYGLEEQEYLASRQYWDLPTGFWLYAHAPDEGALPRTLQRVSTQGLDPGLYVNEQLVGLLKQHLVERDGLVVGTEDTSLPVDTEPRQGGGEELPVRVISRRSPRATLAPPSSPKSAVNEVHS